MNLLRPLALLLCCACGTADLVEGEDGLGSTTDEALTGAQAKQQLDDYLAANVCAGPHSVGCLAPYPTTVHGRAITPYRYRGDESTDRSGVNWFRPHMLAPYLNLLVAARRYDASYEQALTDELEFVLDYTSTHNGARVWENKAGFADAMMQAEYALLLHRLANDQADRGETGRGAATMALAVAFAHALDLPTGPRSGGVRSAQTTCGPDAAHKVDCFFLHSRAGADTTVPGTAINQTLTALRDAATLRNQLEAETRHWPLTAPARADVARSLEKAVIGGLMQLTYGGQGPTLRSFLQFKGSYYWAYYELDANGAGHDISHAHTCHYATLNLKMLADLSDRFEASTWPSTAYRARRGVLGVGLPSESLGQHPTQRPLLQLWLSESHDAVKTGLMQCPYEPLAQSAVDFYREQYP